MPDPDLWPLPHRSWLRRGASTVGSWLSYVLIVAALVVGQSAGPGVDTPSGSLKRRVRKLRSGGSDSIAAQIIGRSSWCPRFPDDTTIKLAWREAVSTLGRDRVIPIAGLTPVAIHPPRTKPGLPRLPRSYWVLDVDGPGGPGSIAATITDLALLGAAAEWPAPPGLPERVS